MGFNVGQKHTEETKRKIGLAHKGKKRPPFSDEWKRKISIANKGKKRTEESRMKISAARKGKYAGVNSPWYGRHHTEEFKKKMSNLKKGVRRTVETIQKMRLAGLGRKASVETRKKMSESRKGRVAWNKGLTGELCFNWRGGKSFEPYTIDWTLTLKRAIRERDHYSCQLCGKTQEDELLCCHHIDYNKKNCNSDNLISLCRRCHSKTNRNREYWANYFKQNL